MVVIFVLAISSTSTAVVVLDTRSTCSRACTRTITLTSVSQKDPNLSMVPVHNFSLVAITNYLLPAMVLTALFLF